MKIFYINGYKGENSNKPKILSEMLNNDVTHIKWIYDVTPYSDIENEVKNADLIIGSSTGSYIARSICEKHNIPLVSYNPVIDINETFNKLNVTVPNIKKPDFSLLDEIIFLNEDDELIDYKKTKLKFPNQTIVFKKGGHIFNNLNDTKEHLINFIKFLYIS